MDWTPMASPVPRSGGRSPDGGGATPGKVAAPQADYFRPMNCVELDVLADAQNIIPRCSPMLLVEQLKVDRERLLAVLKGAGYPVYQYEINLLAIPKASATRVLTNRPRL
jgi:hypothetical protein